MTAMTSFSRPTFARTSTGLNSSADIEFNIVQNVFNCYSMTYYVSQILELTHRTPFAKSRGILVTILLQSGYNNVLMSLLTHDNAILPNIPAGLVQVSEA